MADESLSPFVYFQQFISPTKTVSTDAIIIAKTEKYTAFSERLESISWGITLTESSPWKFEEDKWHALYFCNFVLGNNDFKINMKKTFQ